MIGPKALRADLWRLRCGRRPTPGGRAAATLAFPEADALVAYLGLDGPASVALGTRIVAMRAYLEFLAGHTDPAVALLAFERNAPAAAALEETVRPYQARDGAFVLALTYDSLSLALLARLCARPAHSLLIEASALTPTMRTCFERGGNTTLVRCVDAAELIRTNKERDAGERLTLVTFPFHRAAATRHAREAVFFGRPHRLDVLEALLHFRGASPVLALEAGVAPPRVASYAYASAEPPTEADATELLSFLGRCAESMVRTMPEAFGSVAAMYARSVAAAEVREAMDRSFLRTYLRAWRDAAGAGLVAQKFSVGMAAVGP